MATVLVVDDRPVNRDLLRTVLGYRGHRTLEAADGAEALGLIRADPPDVVITDVVMPGMDGYQLVRELTADPATAAIPVVFYTATYLIDEVRPMAAACGVRHVVTKTGDVAELLTAVDAALVDARAPAAAVTDEEFGREHLRVVNAKLIEKIRELEEAERLHQLVAAVTAVSGDLSLPATLDRIVTAARPLLGARYAALGVVGQDGHVDRLVRSAGDEPAACLSGPPPAGELLDALAAGGVPVRLADLGAAAVGVGLPADPPTPRGFLGLPIRIGAAVFGVLCVADRVDIGEFTAADEALATALAAAAAVAVSNARNYEDGRRRQAWLGASADITALLLAADPADALRVVARGAREVAGAEIVAVTVTTDEHVVIEATDGPVAEHLQGVVLRLAEAPLLREVCATARPIVLSDVAGDARVQTSPLLGVLDLGPVMVVPLAAGDRMVGAMLIAGLRGSPPFAAVDIEMATAFAAHAALALEFARAQRDHQRLTVLEDRDRIARDLHDVVIQRLFGVGLRLGGLRTALPQADALRLSSSVEDLDQTIHDIRKTIFSLRTAPEGRPTLRSRITEVTDRAGELLGFDPRIKLEGPLDEAVPDHVHDDLLATLGEALSNVARHAGATRVDVHIAATGGCLRLEVADDGRGLPQQRHESGLDNLRHRAAGHGGAMTLVAGVGGRGLILTWTAQFGADAAVLGATTEGSR